MPYLAKLKGNLNNNPNIVLYDTCYGHKPLFEDRFSEEV